MKPRILTDNFFTFIGLSALLALMAGWVTNLLMLFHTVIHSETVTGFAIFRAIGVIIAPIGAIIGVADWFY